MSRPISKPEAMVLERVLEVGAFAPVPSALRSTIPSLQVTATCKCGCATIWFGPDRDAALGHKLAEALATADGQVVTVMVWSQADSIVGLEFVGVGQVPLPKPLSVRGYGDA